MQLKISNSSFTHLTSSTILFGKKWSETKIAITEQTPLISQKKHITRGEEVTNL